MTKSAASPVTRETDAYVRRRPVIVAVEARTIELRLKGTRRDRFVIPVDDLFDLLEWRQARAIMREKQQAKRVARKAASKVARRRA